MQSRSFQAVESSDKLLPIRHGPYKIVNKPTEVTTEPLTEDSKTFYTHRNHLILNYLKKPLLSSHNES